MNITEAWQRKYQVEPQRAAWTPSNLPGRFTGASWEDTSDDEHVRYGRVHLARFQDVSHTLFLGDFTLQFQHLRSFDDPDAQAVLVHRQKKRKVEKPVEDQAVTEPNGDDVVMSEFTELEDKQTLS